MKYTNHVQSHTTPQTEPIPGKAMVKNNAGGFVFEVGDFGQLERFLILGAEGGTYYVSEKALTRDNAKCVERCLKQDGLRVVQMIVDVSVGGLAPKNDPAVFALAMALKLGDEKTRAAAKAAVPKVCRTGTHLLHLADAVKAFGGWGKLTTAAFAEWFAAKSAEDIAYQITKYTQRDGWSMKDLVSKSHAGRLMKDDRRQAVLRWATGRSFDAREVKRGDRITAYPALDRGLLPRVIEGVEKVRAAKTSAEAAQLVRDYGLAREVVPTQFLNDAAVWEALLHAGAHGMGLTAMIRNLGKMTSIGLLKPMSDASKYVIQRLSNEEDIVRQRVHPMQFLLANSVYRAGHGVKGSLNWTAVGPVADAVENGFYKAFKAVEPTGLNWSLSLDVSGSMEGAKIEGTHLSAREASVAMALVTANSEASHYMMGFSNTYMPLNISARSSLREAMQTVSRLPFSGTNCSIPMQHALKNKIPVDVFVVYTDNETYAGNEHPVQSLKKYRDAMGRDAKLIVVGMTSTGFTIADPKDRGMLDVVGFSADAPAVMSTFAKR